ncbi:hypothetical protein GQ53DRAFT_466038 [Thozetella sp. PMI_491]|nr:hypothetical protein GQ53DRAFT_466038 [Thozetella sp. PMI_491]
MAATSSSSTTCRPSQSVTRPSSAETSPSTQSDGNTSQHSSSHCASQKPPKHKNSFQLQNYIDQDLFVDSNLYLRLDSPVSHPSPSEYRTFYRAKASRDIDAFDKSFYQGQNK